MGAILEYAVPAAFLVAATATFVRRTSSESFSHVSLLSWRQFERVVGDAFRQRGFEVAELCDPRTDSRMDLILTRADERILVQCKQWRARPIDEATVRDFYEAMTAQRATGGYMVTCGGFTKRARDLARRCRIELIDDRHIHELLH